MKKLITTAAVTGVVAIASTLVGCTKSEPPRLVVTERQAIDLHKQADELRKNGQSDRAAAMDKEAADHYARIGELLLMPESLEYSDEMLAKALELDPTNAKANLYKAVTEPALLNKGFLSRVERLLINEYDVEGIERVRSEVDKLNMPEVSKFANTLPAGERPFIAYYDLQRFMKEKYLPAILGSIEKLNRVDASTPIQLNATPERMKINPVAHDITTTYIEKYCERAEDYTWKCEYHSNNYAYSDSVARNLYFVDKHDLKIIKSSFLAMADDIRVGTAFSFKDIEYLIRRLRGLDKLRKNDGYDDYIDYNDYTGLTAADTVHVLREFSDFFTLEKDNELEKVLKSGPEALRNAMELNSVKAEVCNNPARNEKNALFLQICLDSKVVDTLQMGIDMLTGPKEIKVGRDRNGQDVKILMDLSGFLKNPVKDIKSLLPTSFSDDGYPVAWPDPSMGGIFPNGDFVEKLERFGYDKEIDRGMRAIRHGIHKTKGHI